MQSAIKKFYTGQVTKNVLVGCSAESLGAHSGGKIANEWNIGNETCPDIIKLKHVKNGKNVIVCKNRNKILCVLRQMMQSATFVQARRLKICVGGSTCDAVVH